VIFWGFWLVFLFGFSEIFSETIAYDLEGGWAVLV